MGNDQVALLDIGASKLANRMSRYRVRSNTTTGAGGLGWLLLRSRSQFLAGEIVDRIDTDHL